MANVGKYTIHGLFGKCSYGMKTPHWKFTGFIPTAVRFHDFHASQLVSESWEPKKKMDYPLVNEHSNWISPCSIGYMLKGSIFRCYVSLPECRINKWISNSFIITCLSHQPENGNIAAIFCPINRWCSHLFLGQNQTPLSLMGFGRWPQILKSIDHLELFMLPVDKKLAYTSHPWKKKEEKKKRTYIYIYVCTKMPERERVLVVCKSYSINFMESVLPIDIICLCGFCSDLQILHTLGRETPFSVTEYPSLIGVPCWKYNGPGGVKYIPIIPSSILVGDFNPFEKY